MRTRQVRETRDGRTHVRTEHYRERVNTHYAIENFHFRAWCDLSPPEHALDFIKNFFLTRVQFYDIIELSSTA